MDHKSSRATRFLFMLRLTAIRRLNWVGKYGRFYQSPTNHLRGLWCLTKVSKGEILLWGFFIYEVLRYL